MKYFLMLFATVLFLSNSSNACTMYKITRDGKTIVGNNEDWVSLNTQVWFEPSEAAGEYGVMKVGFLDNFAQGGINEAGLMYDGFAMPYLEIKNTAGKKEMRISQAMAHVMKTCASVRAVKKYLSTINLSSITNGMAVFVDQSGEYLIVEGDELIIGNDAEESFSNFYPSLTKSKSDVDLSYYQNGLKFLNTSTHELSVDYCSSVMKNLAQETGQIAATQYTTIYDLDQLVIRVYHYRNFDNYIDIDLKEELKKDAHRLLIPELFPKDTKAFAAYQLFNNTTQPTKFLEQFWNKNSKEKEGEDLENYKSFFAQVLNTIGYEWLMQKNDAKTASAIFEYGTQLFPENANLFDSYGEALFKNKKYKAAIKNYEKSFALNPENINANEMIQKIKLAQQKPKTLSDEELIRETLMDYIEGSTNGQPARLKTAFHPDLYLYYIRKGALKTWSGKEYILDTKEGQPTGESGKILMIDFENDVAMAKVEISNPKNPVPYIDYFMLLKIGKKWMIIHKAFTKKTSGE